jgi:trimeric autotransporter adhesin
MQWTARGLIAMVGVVAACAGDTPATVEPRIPFRLDPASLELFVSQDSGLRALSTQPAPVSSFPLTWRSVDPSIATVSADGRVRAVAPGTTQIIAASRTDSATAQVRVFATPCALLLIHRPGQLAIAPGERVDVPVTMETCGIRPATAWRFTSGDTAVLRVLTTRDSITTIDGVRAGHATLIVERTDAQARLTALIPVTVR